MAILLRALFLVSISKSKQGRQLFKLDYLFIAIESEVYAIDYKWIDFIVRLHRRRSSSICNKVRISYYLAMKYLALLLPSPIQAWSYIMSSHSIL